jgi:hypothetical protein
LESYDWSRNPKTIVKEPFLAWIPMNPNWTKEIGNFGA